MGLYVPLYVGSGFLRCDWDNGSQTVWHIWHYSLTLVNRLWSKNQTCAVKYVQKTTNLWCLWRCFKLSSLFISWYELCSFWFWWNIIKYLYCAKTTNIGTPCSISSKHMTRLYLKFFWAISKHYWYLDKCTELLLLHTLFLLLLHRMVSKRKITKKSLEDSEIAYYLEDEEYLFDESVGSNDVYVPPQVLDEAILALMIDQTKTRY